MTDYWIERYRRCTNRYTRFLVRQTANVVLPVYYALTRRRVNERKVPIEVSIASFPDRMPRIWLTIETLMRQTVQPERIVIRLARNQFPEGEKSLPRSLRRRLGREVTIEWQAEDLRSYKKFFPAWPTKEGEVLMTADDDIYYPTRLIEKLWERHEQQPTAVIAAYTHEMRYDSDGRLLPYNDWKLRTTEDGKHLFFGSGGGTLFPAGSLYEDAVKRELALRLCPQADDIWLNAMTQLNDTPILRADIFPHILPVLNPRTEKLASTNMDEGLNDKQLAALREYYIRTLNRDPFALKNNA